MDSQMTEEYTNITTAMPIVSSTTSKSTTGKVTTPIMTTKPTTTEQLTTYFVGTTLDPAKVEAERLRKEEEEKKKRIQVKQYAAIFKSLFLFFITFQRVF